MRLLFLTLTICSKQVNSIIIFIEKQQKAFKIQLRSMHSILPFSLHNFFLKKVYIKKNLFLALLGGASFLQTRPESEGRPLPEAWESERYEQELSCS